MKEDSALMEIDEAERLQRERAPLVDDTSPGPPSVTTVAGLDVAYGDDLLAAAVVVLDAETLDVVEVSTEVRRPSFDYVPGLFAFREAPPLLTALERVRGEPDLLVCDGYGRAHPRRFGLACHVGWETGTPTIGVGKTAFIGRYEEPGPHRGDWSPLADGDEIVGRVLRTQDRVKPVFVSVGHRIDLDAAARHVLGLCPRYRLPETTRAADRACRDALADALRSR
jgi:deoxyribonuclease V